MIRNDRTWRKGVFRIAHRCGVKLQPFRIRFQPLRKAAYIDKDNFVVHVMRLLQEKELRAILEFHAPITVENVDDCLRYCQDWAEIKDADALLLDPKPRLLKSGLNGDQLPPALPSLGNLQAD